MIQPGKASERRTHAQNCRLSTEKSSRTAKCLLTIISCYDTHSLEIFVANYFRVFQRVTSTKTDPGAPMRIRWVCLSVDCRNEVEVQIPPADIARHTQAPTCACGGAMKKVYSPPSLRKLSVDEVKLHQGNRKRTLGTSVE